MPFFAKIPEAISRVSPRILAIVKEADERIRWKPGYGWTTFKRGEASKWSINHLSILVGLTHQDWAPHD